MRKVALEQCDLETLDGDKSQRSNSRYRIFEDCNSIEYFGVNCRFLMLYGSRTKVVPR